jgi:elongator complex protein 3
MKNLNAATWELLHSDLQKIKDQNDLSDYKRLLAKKYGTGLILHAQIIEELRKIGKKNKLNPEEKNNLAILQKLLRKRAIRTLSGIAPVAVLTKPYPCPGNCAYCPSEKDVPASYLSNEPAVMRAIRCEYDPYRQVSLRLKALENNGHEPNKIEIIVIGGTWSYLPQGYKYWYILNCFKAANDFQKNRLAFLETENATEIKNFLDKIIKRQNTKLKPEAKIEILKKELAKEQKRNETAKYQIIGLTLETRPDYINDQELLEMRELGATRVEIGVQAIDDKILELNKRGHGVKEIIEATKLLRDYGFKITYHFMPALPGSTPAKDFTMFKRLFTDKDFQPDQIKFYPTVVTKGSLLYKWYKQGKYKPYTDQQLQALIAQCKGIIPRYVRVIRLIRDIPGESIVAGNLITNLRQIMANRGTKCECIRCREAREQKINLKDIQFNEQKYPANGGTEYFLSCDSKDGQTLFGFCRLSINHKSPIAPAIIRELHVYGELVPIGGESKTQHSGLGKRLMAMAEAIAKKEKCQKLAIISGVGVRGYYKKQGYKLKDTYLVKNI